MARMISAGRNLATLIDEGLGTRAAYMHSEYDDFFDWVATGRRWFPNASLATLQAAWRWTEAARYAGADFLQQNILPPLGVVPRDPTIPANREFRYELLITLRDRDPTRVGTLRDQTTTIGVIYHSNTLQTQEQLMRSAPRSIIAGIERRHQRRFDRYPTTAGWQDFAIEIEVRSVARRT